MGSAVDKENITRIMEEFSEAGIGGVEIIPIYGAKGYEKRYLEYLSPRWMEMLIHTLDEAERLGMGVDMTLGTGWPYGGPQVEPEHAAGKMYIRSFTLKAGQRLRQKITGNEPDEVELAKLQNLTTTFEKPDMPATARLQHLFAFGKEGRKLELTSKVINGELDWEADMDCDLYAIFLGNTGQMVKRSAPGGAGLVLDHFSGEAVKDFLEPFNEALGPVQNRLRSIFNDSYEIYEADLTPGFFEEFKKRRGYELSDHIPLLLPGASGEDAVRILSDYRETLSDLLLEKFSGNWNRWAREHTFITTHQAHGSPGNLLDIYAAADIQECESFYGTRFDIPGFRWDTSDAEQAEQDMIMLKFASSGTHIAGKNLTSSETFTWLREHFKTALSQCKPELEQILLSGVNHMFLHGSTYSPADAPWPGWKFYASVNFSPLSSIWKDTPSFFNYVARSQSMLQTGKSDNELLIYWPYYDVIDDVNDSGLGGQFLYQLSIHNKDHWLVPSAFYQVVTTLMEQGYAVDFVSDRYLRQAVPSGGKTGLSGQLYKALVIPECTHMPLETFSSITGLIKGGSTVVFEALPETVPGFYQHEQRTARLQQLISETAQELIVSSDLPGTLAGLGINGESLKELGLGFIRRDTEGGKIYYLVNHTPQKIDGYIPLNCACKSVMIMDPLTGKTGLGNIKPGRTESEVYLQMRPGDAMILRTFNRKIHGEAWQYFEVTGDPVEIAGPWELQFISGGPSIPASVTMDEPLSWTMQGKDAEAFSGTARYTTKFRNPDPDVTHWLLDLGDVRESARVWINGKETGCFWSVPFTGIITVPEEGENILEIEVTNLPANRIRDMERRGVEWKIFYNINIVSLHYKKFDATAWDPMPSGLVGRVTLSPLRSSRY